jgi:hypothetical protein
MTRVPLLVACAALITAAFVTHRFLFFLAAGCFLLVALMFRRKS